MISPAQAMFKVRGKDGRIWDIPESNLDTAIARGGEPIETDPIAPSPGMGSSLVDASQGFAPSPSPTPPKTFKIQAKDGRIWEVPEANLEKAKSRGAKVLEDTGPELGFTDRLLQFGRGVAEVPAVAADLTNRYVAAPALNAVGGATQLAGKAAGLVSEDAGNFLEDKAQDVYKARDYYKNTDVSGQVGEGFNKLAGKDITPKDKTGKILKAAGEFSFPLSNVVKGAKTAGEAAAAVGKHVGVAAGGATALEGTKDLSLFKEDSLGHHVEDFLKTVVGMSIADKGLSAAKKKILGNIGEDLEKVVGDFSKGEKRSVGEKVAGKVLSVGAKPNAEVNAIAEKEGIQLPFEVALGGKPQKFLANTGLKSFFVGKAYNQVIEHADRDMINAVKTKLDTIDPNVLSGELASIEALGHLKSEKDLIKKEYSALYEHSNSLMKEFDKVKPQHTYEAMRNILPKISVASPSKDMEFVAKRIAQIGEEWGFLPKNKDLKEWKDYPELLKQIKLKWGKAGEIQNVPLGEIDSQLKALKNDLNYERDIPGVKNLLNGFISALEKDLASSANKEFVEARSKANSYFKNQEVDRIRTDLASSLMNGEIPKEAFVYMESAPKIRQLQKVMGDSKNAKDVLASLKRAKLEQVFLSNILDSSGTISYAKFSNMFLKSPEKQALLKELLGDTYGGMKDLAKVSQQFVKVGKDFGNPSKTSFATRDQAGMVDLVKISINSAATLLGGTFFHGLSYKAALEPGAIWLLSQMASNKRYVNSAVKYAEASAKGKTKDKEVWAKRVARSVESFLGEKIEKYPQSLLSLKEDSEERKKN